MSRTVFLNGSFVPYEEAKISVMDRGFLFADGIYEVAAVLDGRLVDNCDAKTITDPDGITDDEFAEAMVDEWNSWIHEATAAGVLR